MVFRFRGPELSEKIKEELEPWFGKQDEVLTHLKPQNKISIAKSHCS
jgi:hypothetical protein